MTNTDLKVGFGRVDITPPLGIPMAGYTFLRKASAIRDALELNVLAVSDGRKTAVILTADLLDLQDNELALVMRRRIAAAAGAPVEAGAVSFSVKDVSIPSNRPKPEDLPTAHKYSELHAAGKDDQIPFTGMELTTVVAEAGRMLRLENGPDAFSMPVSTVSIGNAVRFIGIPGEPFTEIGRRIKEGSPAAMTFVSCITNGYYGYFPTANAYQEGGYEARASIFGPTVADNLIRAARG